MKGGTNKKKKRENIVEDIGLMLRIMGTETDRMEVDKSGTKCDGYIFLSLCEKKEKEQSGEIKDSI